MSMSNVRRLGSQFTISIPSDPDGYRGRECPQCNGYFKIVPGTGLTGSNLPCVCPYCGHRGSNEKFITQDQLKYAKSVVLNQVTGALMKDLKAMEFNHPARGSFGIGISLKVTKGEAHPIRHYREKALETELVCDGCTLKYAIYGLFAHCPDCGAHNSRQILENNLSLAEKELVLATASAERGLADHLRGDALENVVSSFDGFGRKVCAIGSTYATNSGRANSTSFQNLKRAQTQVLSLFAFDLSSVLSVDGWNAALRGFQKRHLLAHTMGIVDADYIAMTSDRSVAIGRKVIITNEEVMGLISIVRKMAAGLEQNVLKTMTVLSPAP